MTKTITLAQAQERLEEIASHRAQLVATRIALDERLETAQKEIGRRYLAGDRSGLQEAAEIRQELAAIESALELLETVQNEADIDLKRATALDLRQQATKKRAELERLNNETQALLAKLSDLEGVRYSHGILNAQPLPEMWVTPELKQPESWHSMWELIPNKPGDFPNIASPRSRNLRGEISELELKAHKIEETLPIAA